MYTAILSMLISGIFTPYKVGADNWRFAVIGDTQINKHIMCKAIKSMNKRKLAFTVHIGDMDYVGDPALWRRSMSYVIKAKVPWFYAIGNHELYSNNPTRYWPTKRRWVRFWYGWGDTFRVFHHRHKKFVIIDSSSSFMPNSHHKRLENALKTAKNKSVFLFTHKPLPYYKNFKVYFGPNKLHYVWYSYMAGMKYKWSNIALWRIVKKYKNKILAVFHGHDHSFRKYSLDGIQVFCSGGGGGRLETKHDYYHYLEVLVNNHGYAVKVVKL